METVEWQKTREGLGTPQVIRILELTASELVAMHTSSNVDKVKLNKLKVQNYISDYIIMPNLLLLELSAILWLFSLKCSLANWQYCQCFHCSKMGGLRSDHQGGQLLRLTLNSQIARSILRDGSDLIRRCSLIVQTLSSYSYIFC